MDYEQEDISECLANLFLDKFVINSLWLSSKDIAEGLHQYNSKKSSCYRKKWEKYPKLPASLNTFLVDTDI